MRRGIASLKKLCKMNEEQPTAKTDGSSLQEGYENSKSLWEYKNIFSFPPDAWFLSILNHPTVEHWIMIGIHSRKKQNVLHLWLTGKKKASEMPLVSISKRKLTSILHLRVYLFLLWVEGRNGRMLNVLRNFNWIHTIAERWF